MPITFAEPVNNSIKSLVDICYAHLQVSPKGTLISKPVNEIYQAQYEFDNDQNEYPEDEGDVSSVSEPIQAYPFTPSNRIINNFIIAVDSGVVPLGQIIGGGVAFAIRGAAICYANENLLVLTYNSGPLLITPQNKPFVFRYIGQRLGEPSLYIDLKDGKLIPQPSAVDTPNQIEDRCRSFIERIIQEEAIAVLKANGGGILLLDGALTHGFDTPKTYLKTMLKTAETNKIDVCAISKKSRIMIGGISIDSLFDQHPYFVGFAPLMKTINKEREAYIKLKIRSAKDITAGTEVFAARFGFGPPGLTFRVDVYNTFGSTNEDVINDIYSKCRITGGYPKPLIDAHHYSTFLGGDILSLQADLVARTGLKIKEEPSLGILFQPFGAFGK